MVWNLEMLHRYFRDLEHQLEFNGFEQEEEEGEEEEEEEEERGGREGGGGG